MAIIRYIESSSFVHRIDPRVRLVTACAFSLLAALTPDPRVAAGVLLLALGLLAAARLPAAPLWRRLGALNVFVAAVAVGFLFFGEGPVWARWGPVHIYEEGIHQALLVFLKSHAVLLLFTVLVSTIEPVVLGHAMSHLNIPDPLIQLFLFTIRYTEVLHREYLTLRKAMRARGFRAGLRRVQRVHLAQLIGMLLVRSLDRSERILQAMKCRGFHGSFFLMHHFHGGPQDRWFGVSAAVAWVLLAGVHIL